MKFNYEDVKILEKLFGVQDWDVVENNDEETIKTSNNTTTQSFDYITNRDASLRWLIPSEHSQAYFLNFYSAASFKAKCYVFIVQMLYRLGLKSKIINGSILLKYNDECKYAKIVEGSNAQKSAIFMGTVGPNRKAIVWTQNEIREAFYKIPLNEASQRLIQNEAIGLENISALELELSIVPKLLNAPDVDVLGVESIKRNNAVRPNKLQLEHHLFFEELYSKVLSYQKIDELTFFDKIEQQINQIRLEGIFGVIADKLSQLANEINTQKNIPVSIVHGDFTPWNQYLREGNLYLYDWELTMEQAPILMDAYHFIFQKGVLVEGKNFVQIANDVAKLERSHFWQNLVEMYNVDVQLHYHLYLLYTISYYTLLYQNQENLHEQAYWLLSVWNDALSEELTLKETDKTYREVFIKEVFGYLKEIPYALMKFTEENLDKIPESSDLDIVIKQDDLDEILANFKRHPLLKKMYKERLSYATYVDLFFKDGSFLRVDLIYQFKRKDKVYLDTVDILQNTQMSGEGVKVPSTWHNFEYCLLFYFLNYSGVPDKYIQYFESQNPETQLAILHQLSEKYNLELVGFQTLADYDKTIGKQLTNGIKHLAENQGRIKWKKKIDYTMDSAKRKLFQKGMVLSFSGVDGAGKSTVIERIKEKIEEKYRRKTIVLRHRPSLLPILSAFRYGKKGAEERAVSRLPRTGENKSSIGSVFRFMYYYLDYLIGQVYVYFKYIRKGYIVLYDRYYFDFVHDAKRSNIVMDKGISKFLYKFIYKPNLNIFLYADAEEILKRKKELSEKDINNLTKDYASLFDEFKRKYKYTNSKYVQIKNVDLDFTIKRIMNEMTVAM